MYLKIWSKEFCGAVRRVHGTTVWVGAVLKMVFPVFPGRPGFMEGSLQESVLLFDPETSSLPRGDAD